jgi:hypothetical protein
MCGVQSADDAQINKNLFHADTRFRLVRSSPKGAVSDNCTGRYGNSLPVPHFGSEYLHPF